jgi:hypothetical protein
MGCDPILGMAAVAMDEKHDIALRAAVLKNSRNTWRRSVGWAASPSSVTRPLANDESDHRSFSLEEFFSRD